VLDHKALCDRFSARHEVGTVSDAVVIAGHVRGALAELIDDPDRFLSVVLVLTEGQRKAAGLKTQEEFEDRFDGPTLQAARVALTESVTNFYHPPKTAAEMTAALRMAWTAGDELTAAKIAAAANGSTSNDLATNSAAPAA
jgi:hypothetical protein